MTTLYNPKAVANFFLQASTKEVTQMLLHRYIYFSQGWYLGLYGRPLIDEMLVAEDWGPITPSVFQEFRDVGSRMIDRLATEIDWSGSHLYTPVIEAADVATLAYLKRIWTVYAPFSAAQLREKTNAVASPWYRTREANPLIRRPTISNDVIQDYFRNRIEIKATRDSRSVADTDSPNRSDDRGRSPGDEI